MVAKNAMINRCKRIGLFHCCSLIAVGGFNDSLMSHLTEGIELTMALNMDEKCVQEAASLFHSEVVK